VNNHLVLGLALLVGISLTADATAVEESNINPRNISWKDLIPAASVTANPLAKYSKSQLLALTDIATVRDRRARGEQISPIDKEDEFAAATRLKKEGLDVDALLAYRAEFGALKKARALAVNESLDGLTIRMAGYLLPLEYEGKEVTEFLLVPWVGACVHTPPPPPNQIVFVKAKDSFAFQGMFTPVQITGRMSTGKTTKSLYLIDGASDISIGYVIESAAVEPYTDGR